MTNPLQSEDAAMKTACPRGNQRPEPGCDDRSQCWEPCGELGKRAEHARPADAETTDAINAAVSWKCDKQCQFVACREARQCTMPDDLPCGHMLRGVRKSYCARCQRAASPAPGVDEATLPPLPEDWRISAIADRHTTILDGARVLDEISFGRELLRADRAARSSNFDQWRISPACETACAAIRRNDPTTALREAFSAGRSSNDAVLRQAEDALSSFPGFATDIGDERLVFIRKGAAALTALRSPPEAPRARLLTDAMTCWLVEKRKDGRTVGYLGHECGSFDWFPTPGKATRFSRREDASGVAECISLEDVIVVEHIWG